MMIIAMHKNITNSCWKTSNSVKHLNRYLNDYHNLNLQSETKKKSFNIIQSKILRRSAPLLVCCRVFQEVFTRQNENIWPFFTQIISESVLLCINILWYQSSPTLLYSVNYSVPYFLAARYHFAWHTYKIRLLYSKYFQWKWFWLES